MVALDVLTFGETLVGLTSSGPLSLPGTLLAEARGAESNVAIGLARLGHRVRWATRVSTDAYSSLVVRTVRGEGVDVVAAVDPDRPTALMLLARRTADVAVVEYRRAGSAASALERVDVPLGCVPRVLHATGITPALSPRARETWTSVLHDAKDAGALVSLDLNYRARLWRRDEASDCLREVIGLADIVIASEDEVDLVADSASDLLKRGVAEVVVKKAAAGAEVTTADGTVAAAGIPVTAVDPVGAGDAFCAGYLSGLLDGLDVRQRLARGVLLGAFCVSTQGDWAGLPTRSELGLLGGSETTIR